MLQYSRSLAVEISSHLSCNHCGTDTILVNHRRSTHESFTQATQPTTIYIHYSNDPASVFKDS